MDLKKKCEHCGAWPGQIHAIGCILRRVAVFKVAKEAARKNRKNGGKNERLQSMWS